MSVKSMRVLGRRVTAKNTTVPTPFSSTWDFTTSDSASYTFDPAKVEFSSDVAKLIGVDHIDRDNSGTQGFAAGIHSSTVWDSTESVTRLATTGATNDLELDAIGAPQPTHLVGLYHLNETVGTTGAASVIDASVQANHATPTGAITFGNAGKLRGRADLISGQYIDIPKTTANDFGNTQAFTLSVWVNRANSTPACLLNDAPEVGPYSGHWFCLNAAGVPNVALVDSTTSVKSVYANNAIPANTWVLLMATYNGNGNASGISIYVNGEKAPSYVSANTAYTGTVSNAYPWRIGADSAVSPSDFFSGSIDEVAIWNVDLSASEIYALYQRQSPLYTGKFTSRVFDAGRTDAWSALAWIPSLPYGKPLPDAACTPVFPATTCAHTQNETSTDYPKLVGSLGGIGDNDLMTGIQGLWHLDEVTTTGGAANDFNDASGLGNHGEAVGTPVFGVPGKFGMAPRLTAGASIDVGTGINLNGQSFTLSAWAKKSSNGRDQFIFSNGINITSQGMHFGFRSNDRFTFAFYGDDMDDTVAHSDSEWHHYLGTFDASTRDRRLYIDGVLVKSGTSGATYQGSGTTMIGGLAFPGFNGVQTWEGALDEAAIWTRVLRPEEVTQLYLRGANRIKFQARVCAAAGCTDDPTGAAWKGPDGTPNTYFSELNSNSSPLAGTGYFLKQAPRITFSDFTSPAANARYFQYRTFFESDDAGSSCTYASSASWCSPELKRVDISPSHYSPSGETIVIREGNTYASLGTLTETLSGTCTSGVGYNLGVGTTAASATWYHWDATANAGAGKWVAADGTSAQGNSATVVNAHLSTFASDVPPSGTSLVFLKLFLNSSGTSACGVDSITLTGTH